MAEGLYLPYATDRRPKDTPTVCKVLYLVTDQRLPNHGQVQQLGPSALAATAIGLWTVSCVVLGLSGACHHSLCQAAHQGTTDSAGCTPLLMSWIYQRFFSEWGTWMSVVPLVCFNLVEFHQVDRVKRQFNGEQLVSGASTKNKTKGLLHINNFTSLDIIYYNRIA
ncbi:hypothetical protein Ahy_B10g102199 [Arachis hypogaea]|uniref:Aminotransferase-like plant mobile domain-containing protein n=1 Tax=Arachis hypogaea TaxID=3818 RepID=A0A444X1A5_ARAHY|nr:hypothetical protein Ahy_B10g102199 [Arachis hypogaea]